MTRNRQSSDKSFDAVQLMRDLREQLSGETQGLSFEEEKAFLQEQLKNFANDERTKSSRESS